jgi:CheY-like chemotaxis protein
MKMYFTNAPSTSMNVLLHHPGQVDDRILIVDDVADNSFLLQTLLESEGYKVEVADSGQVALEKIVAAPPALVLLDVMMPGMSGFEVTRQIRQNGHLPFIPIVLVSGYDQPSLAQALNIGANGFIRKPIDFEEVINQVKALLFDRD